MAYLWTLSLTIICGFCNFAEARSCMSTINGAEYTGDVSITRGGRTCQRWEAQNPHPHSVTIDMLPDTSWEEAGNFCRSPGFDSLGPWCYTTDSNVTWEYCRVPRCDEEAKVGCTDTEKGGNYIGAQNFTANNKSCVPWDEMVFWTAFGYLSYDTVRFPDGNLNHAFCRNPLGQRDKLWCHTSDTEWGYCDVPLCEIVNPENQMFPLDDRRCMSQGGSCTQKNCCKNDYYVSNLCSDTELVCCLSDINCNWNKSEETVLNWPLGDYGILASTFGCPGDPKIKWKSQNVKLGREKQGYGDNTWPAAFHLHGPYSRSLILLNVCEKKSRFVDEVRSQTWPKGNYCVVRTGDKLECPEELRSITIRVESDIIQANSTLVFDERCDNNNSCLLFGLCCSEATNSESMKLPNISPFVLLKAGKQCSSIEGMSLHEEKFSFPLDPNAKYFTTEPTDAITMEDQNLQINLCYYSPNDEETCFLEKDRGFYYSGHVNTTQAGPCQPWDNITKIDYKEMYDYVGLMGTSSCRNSMVFERLDKPWCYSGGVKVTCEIPICNYTWESYPTVGVGKPARQSSGDTAQLANDGILTTCSVQDSVKAWWQVDLQSLYEVYAIQILRYEVEICVLRLFDVYVDKEENAFLHHGTVCAYNKTAGAADDGVVRCVQPVVGQYVTISNLVHIESESIPPNYEKCLYICEIEIFVKDTECGRLLLDEAVSNEIIPYYQDNTGNEGPVHSFALYGPTALCLSQDSKDLYFMINLLYTRRMQGLIMQGSREGTGSILSFSLEYGQQAHSMISYQEYPNKPKVFMQEESKTSAQRHMFLNEISGSILKINIIEYHKIPCLRLDILGCNRKYVDLLRGKGVSQSSLYKEHMANNAIDEDITTCADTKLEDSTWWRADLDEEYEIHSVVMKTGLAFGWNLAALRPSYAISEGWHGYPYKANDGNSDAHYFYGGSCSHSQYHNHPWWVVDLQRTRTVTSVKIAHRADCCAARNEEYFIGISNNFNASNFDPRNIDKCLSHTGKITNIIDHNYCDTPMLGRYLAFVLPSDQFLTLCELMVYGERDPLTITIGETDVTPSSSCIHSMDVLEGESVHSMVCEGQGNSLNVALPTSGPMSICTINVYGGYPAMITRLSSEKVLLVCRDTTAQLHINFKQRIDYQTDINGFLIEQAEVADLIYQCEGHQSCYFTTKLNSLEMKSMIEIKALCSHVIHKDTFCKENIDIEKRLTTPNYPYYYGDGLSCRWVIMAPRGQFAALNVSNIILASYSTIIEDGCDQINQGYCDDTAMVYYNTKDANHKTNGKPVKNATFFISNGPELVFEFISCTRHKNLLQGDQYGIEAYSAFYGCGGCNTQSEGSSFTCTGQTCGMLVSRGFPHMYNPNEKMSWTIVVDEQHFIELVFEEFDVYEHPLLSCLRDYVEVYDYDLVDHEYLLGRYCNSDKPRIIHSSWNKIKVAFTTDYETESIGFVARYQQLQYQLPKDFPWYGYSAECPKSWIYYKERCYHITTRDASLSWLEAENTCKRTPKSHLLSIRTEEDMVFIHYMLTNLWKTNQTMTFIGINDRRKEGYWRWSDGQPVTYSDWAVQTEGGREIRQPDGGDVEDCAMIRLDNLYSTRTWHDIPCAYNEVKQYICVSEVHLTESDDDDANGILHTSFFMENNHLPERETRFNISNTFECSDSVMILSKYVCDGRTDCRDGKDEVSCTNSNIIFKCDDGDYISMSSYCDYQFDCADQSDEKRCVMPLCNYKQWTCSNGECIDIKKRCDLLNDCKDNSDEINCDICQEDVAFQCFDGSCIPKGKRCDGIIDCPGSLHEDESDECIDNFIQPSCLDWKIKGHIESGRYFINPKGSGLISVECNMDTNDGYIQTTIHHNGENRAYVTGYANVGDYEKHFDYYGLTREDLIAVKNYSLFCHQYMKIECLGASGTSDDYWLNIDGKKVMFHDKGNERCQCILSSACETNRSTCYCTESEVIIPRAITIDEGLLSDKEDLPVMAISLSGTGFHGHQSQYHTLGPMICYQSGSYDLHRIKCGDETFVGEEHRCKMDVDEYGQTTGCKDASHLIGCEQYECPPMYRKCPNSYCIPPQMICDGKADCSMGEEERGCGNYSCGGMYQCHKSSVCIEHPMICDGTRQCPEGDDEQECDFVCPDFCSCFGTSVSCPGASLQELPRNTSLFSRTLDLENNNIELTNRTFSGFRWLGQLILSKNVIMKIPPKSFVDLENLFLLNLSFNELTYLAKDTFFGLRNLLSLDLAGNHNLHNLAKGCMSGLDNLPSLDLSMMKIDAIYDESLLGLQVLRKLNISRNVLKNIDSKAFASLAMVKTLDISENRIEKLTRETLDQLPLLDRLHGDSFKYCCFVRGRVLEENCLPERDAFSSCDDLMRRDILKIFLWVLGLMAFLCNAFVIIWRIREKMNVYSFCVFNLAIADFFMGVYMVTLASVDLYYRGVYIEYAEQWQSSWLCTLLGFLNSLSSEASVFTLCLISADRFYKIVFPFQGSKFDIKKARKVTALVWLFAIVIAALPLFPIKYFEGKFYARSSVCLSLHITNEITPGWEYSWAIFHGLNFTCFIFIFICYSYLYHIVKKSTKSTAKMAHGRPAASDISLARKLTLVVATDFICWVPINIIGVAAICGAEISSEVYAWVVVFALPINSAINPLLYTVSSLQGVQCCKKRDLEDDTKSSIAVSKTGESDGGLYLVTAMPGEISVRRFILDRPSISVSLCMEIATGTAELLAEIHSRGQGVGKIDTTTVRIQNALNPEVSSNKIKKEPRCCI